MSQVKKISSDEADALIERWITNNPREDDYGKFYCKGKDGRIAAIDNAAGHCWVEDFGSVSAARYWLSEY